MFGEYERQAGKSLEEEIKKEMSGDLEKIFLAMSNKFTAYSSEKYFLYIKMTFYFIKHDLFIVFYEYEFNTTSPLIQFYPYNI